MVTTRGPGLVGRSTERELLDGLLARVRAGESDALVIRGEAGFGKTALLRYTARQAAGFQVLDRETMYVPKTPKFAAWNEWGAASVR